MVNTRRGFCENSVLARNKTSLLLVMSIRKGKRVWLFKNRSQAQAREKKAPLLHDGLMEILKATKPAGRARLNGKRKRGGV